MLKLLLVMLVVVGCTRKTQRPQEMALSDELDVTLPSLCNDKSDYRIQKKKGDSKIYIDEKFIWDVARWDPKPYKRFPTTADMRLGKFGEVKYRDRTIESPEKREYCELVFDFEYQGKVERCYYGRHFKDMHIWCPTREHKEIIATNLE